VAPLRDATFRGPLPVTVAYRVPEPNRAAFVAVMRAAGRSAGDQD
jgi:hypothetical protein